MEFDSAIKLKQVFSLDKGNYLIVHACNTLNDVPDGILIGSQNKRFQLITETQQSVHMEQKLNIALSPLSLKDAKAF